LGKIFAQLSNINLSGHLDFGDCFFLLFYRQASVTQTNLGQLSVVANQPAVATGNTDIRLNLGVLSSQKFLNLRAATAATPVFTSGKINPFVAQ